MYRNLVSPIAPSSSILFPIPRHSSLHLKSSSCNFLTSALSVSSPSCPVPSPPLLLSLPVPIRFPLCPLPPPLPPLSVPVGLWGLSEEEVALSFSDIPSDPAAAYREDAPFLSALGSAELTMYSYGAPRTGSPAFSEVLGPSLNDSPLPFSQCYVACTALFHLVAMQSALFLSVPPNSI